MTPAPEGLPRRDLWLLPLLSVATVLILLSVSEVTARYLWGQHLEDSCARHDPLLGTRFAPNCHSYVKSAESPRVENVYNSCGFRSAGSCGPKTAGVGRVALIGTSTGSGYLVPYHQTFYALAATQIEQQCHIVTDFQNLAVPGVGPEKALLRLKAALALQPDVVLMPVSAHDLDIIQPDEQQPVDDPPPEPAFEGKQIVTQLVKTLRGSRVMLMAQHYLYMNEDEYLPLYLQHKEEADFLRSPMSAQWRAKLSLFDREVGRIAARANAEGASFMIVYIPQRAQALLLRWQHLPSGINPSLLGEEVGAIAARHQVTYLDLTQMMGDRPDVVSLFYPVDSHPNAAGSALIGAAVAKALVADSPVFASCREKKEAER